MSHFFRELTPQLLCVAFLVGVLGTPAVWSLHRKLNRHHAERLALETAHHKRVMAALGRSEAPPDGRQA